MIWTWAKRRFPPPPLPLFHCRPSFVGQVYLQGIILYPICPINSLFIWSLSYEFKKHILYIVLWSPVPCPTQLKWWFRVWQALLFHDGCCQLSWWWGKGGWLVAFLLQLATGRILGWDTTAQSQTNLTKQYELAVFFVDYIKCVHLYLFIRRGIWRKPKLTVCITHF